MVRRRSLVAFIAAALFVAQVSAVAASTARSGTVDGGAFAAPVDKTLASDLAAGRAHKIVVEFKAKADLRAPSKVADHAKRGQAVLNSLTATAQTSQRSATAIVNATKGVQGTSYWLTNVMVVSGDPAALAKVASRLARDPAVSSIRAENIYPLVKPIDPKVAVLAAAGDPEWGVAKIRADEAWAKGILGQGVVVANVDTGVDYTHPALVGNYRGNNHDGTFTHAYNWSDPAGVCDDPAPCDNVGHGTHTMGTIAGGDGPGPFTPDIGVAPGVTWFAAKGCEDLDCTESSLLSAGQFILAPTDLAGLNPRPELRPDVVNNSWGGGPNDPFYLETVLAWRAAGIIPVFASGNPGPGCGDGGSPGDFLETFSAGATDDEDEIADFSGRGPSFFGKINPDISAPGVDVVSSVPGGGYEAFSGTSMATPHTVGTIALVLSAKASLLGDIGNFGPVTDAIRATAVDRIDLTCGGDDDGDPNNTYGDGRIDAAAATNLVATGGTLSGTVTEINVITAVAGAKVTADDGTRTFSATTDATGDYSMLLAAGSYNVSVTAFGYFGGIATGVVIQKDQTTDQDFALALLPRFNVTGTITAAEDHSPIQDVSVRAIGTPVPPVTTNAAGVYHLVLPIGTYTLRATADGCTEVGTAEIVSAASDVVQDFSLFRKLDDFGHACAPIPFDWVDANGQSALFGDDVAGRLRLPFSFDFYGTAYDAVFPASNGYLNFLEASADFIPTAIPSPSAPNAAIYPFWQDLVITEVGGINSQVIGASPNRAFVIEYSQVKVFGGRSLLDFEMKLWENGTIDFLYGPNAPNPGDGRLATIGIENAAGTDALQIGFLEPNVGANRAIRITTVPTGLVSGTVVDFNDDGPIGGASVTATPGGRTVTTADDGTYTLRLLPGAYTVTASADLYVDSPTQATVVDGGTVTRNFALRASTATAAPDSISASVDYGASAIVDVTLSNGGSAPLEWTAKERNQGVDIPPLPEPSVTYKRIPNWTRQAVPDAFPRYRALDTSASADLSLVIDDPVGDSTGGVDVDTVRGGSDGTNVVSMALDFSPSTPIDQVAGYVYLDTDEDPNTGVPAEFLSGLPTQDIGAEFFLDLFGTHDPEPVVFVLDAETFETTAIVPARFEGQSLLYDIPLEALGGDDGKIATGMVLGDFFEPMDWAPDIGHGTIEPFSDVPWMTPDPATGTVAPGGQQHTLVTLGGGILTPGTYHAKLVFVTNAPKSPQLPIDVTLEVRMPAAFGSVRGTVTDAHDGDPIAGASVAVHAQWPAGTPLDLVATTGDDGTYSIIGPEGTWPSNFTLDGYVPVNRDVKIVRGVTTPGVDVALHRIQPHASLDGDTEPTFILLPDRQDGTTLTLGNPEGHADLTFETGEVNLGVVPDDGLAAATGIRQLPANFDPNAKTTRGFGALASGTAVPPRLAADGDVLASWPSDMSLPWGVAYTSDVWLSDPFDLKDVKFTTAGDRLDEFSTASVFGDWGGDMAFDQARGWIWQVNVGGDNGIYALDPADGSVKDVITGSPWSNQSQRGLAYDPNADVFYIGGWDQGIVYRVAGPSHADPGETLSQCSPPDPNISGLAWNGSFGLLWEATNSETDDIWLIDPTTCEASRAIPHPDGGGFGGAGIELDVLGNIWTVGQNSLNAYLIDSGLPTFSDVPWLTVTPTDGTVAPNGSASIDIAVDSAGLEPGLYRAIVAILTNDPDHSVMQVPVTLVVPSFQQGINPGGGDFVAGDETLYAADRPYNTCPGAAKPCSDGPSGGNGTLKTPDTFGWVGHSEVAKDNKAIDGTDDDGLYQNLREGATGYKFTVPNGIYLVQLDFAELKAKKPLERVFGVRLEGEDQIPALDVFQSAGGNHVALDLSLTTVVSDGVLDIDFLMPRGHKSIVNGILITLMPPGSSGD